MYINAREIRELKDTLNSTRRELDDVRSELKRQNNTIAKVTWQVKCKNGEQVYFKRQLTIAPQRFFPVGVTDYSFDSSNVFSTLDPKHVRNKLIFFSTAF